MDTQGLIQEHSRIKLELYRLYLERYLAVLLVTPFFESIAINDVFAGSGISSNNEKGSAVIAAEAIEKLKGESNKYNKTILLNLNDRDPKNCKELATYLKKYDFVTIENEEADKLIQDWSPTPNTHNLFFIDPHGYTQISTENLKRLFSMERCDFLIFIPIYHIYRFLSPSGASEEQETADEGILSELGIEAPEKRQADSSNFYEPIARFLSGLGIDQEQAEEATSVERFSDVIVSALKQISKSDHVYAQMLENRTRNSKYCLFFISSHVLGAEKFLEAQHALKTNAKELEQQQAFDFVSEPDDKSILNFVDHDIVYDNVSLYEQGIKWGFRPTEITAELKDLEKNQPGKIEITVLPGKERKRRGSFFINYDHYKMQNRRISIKFK